MEDLVAKVSSIVITVNPTDGVRSPVPKLLMRHLPRHYPFVSVSRPFA